MPTPSGLEVSSVRVGSIEAGKQPSGQLLIHAVAASMDHTNVRYRIQGQRPLRGDIMISGSKNAALPLLAGSILAIGTSTYHNVPHLKDVDVLLAILAELGATYAWEGSTVRIDTTNVHSKPLNSDLASRLRASIVLLGPLLARFGEASMSYPGGDVIGKRPVYAHIAAFEQIGIENFSTEDTLHLKGTCKPAAIILPEFSVTATENAILAAARTPGETRIDLAAAEPHVQACCRFVEQMGARVQGAGTHTIVVHGNPDLTPVGGHTVIPDYLEAGSFVLAALATKGKVRLHGADVCHLTAFLDAVKRMGGIWKVDESGVLFVDGEISSLSAAQIRTNIFPGFPTDLLAPMGVVMTQAKGVSRIFERMYEGRMAYLFELEKMGAHVEILNSHQALIIGPTPLKGRIVASNDVRAGVATVLAGLCASGETIVTDVQYIERGYDRLEEKLTNLGAKIVREAE